MKRYYAMIVGLVAGFASAALGIGGGVILIPALLVLFHLDMKKALGTSLLAVAPTALVGVIAHYFLNSSNLDFVVAGFMILGALVGTKIGTELTKKFTSLALKRAFAVLLVLTAVEVMGIIEIPVMPIDGSFGHLMLILFGVLVGMCSALFGVGGGIVMVPILNIFYGLDMHTVVATSLLVILPTTIVGAYLHGKQGNLDVPMAKMLVPTAFIGAIIGAFVANLLPSRALEVAFGVVMIVSAVKIVLEKK